MADKASMRALSIRQPWAELILRGIKTVEYRSRPTKIIGERFWIYASKGQVKSIATLTGVKADNIAVAEPPPWMAELANALQLFPQDLPTGVIVGSAVIERCDAPAPLSPHPYYCWHLRDVERATSFRKPQRHPQPVWFDPF
jgi:hypothetical protein